MSHPPQPPQPPQPSGGGGEPAAGQPSPYAPPPPGQAPQSPPPAGPPQSYGYPPAQPPAQPGQGYGHPQAPQPPQQQPGYAYPQQPPAPGHNPYAPQQPAQAPPPQQPGGWGQPSAPGGNPYAYPQQQQPQPYPTVPVGSAAGGRRMSGNRLVTIISAVVSLAVVIGVGIWLATSGGDTKTQADGGTSGGSSQGTTGGGGGGSHTAQGKVQWTVAAPKVSKAQIIGKTPGMWFQGNDVIKQSTTEVTAYDLTSGSRHWSVPTPAGRTCDAAEGSVSDKIAVQYGIRCENVMVIDISTGKLLWHKPLPSNSTSAYEFDDMDMAISGNTVAMSWDDRTVSFVATTGASGWHSGSGDTCQDAGFAGGAQMVEVYKCGFADSAPYHVALIDPATGKAKWTWDAPAGTEVSNVISVNPVVVGIGAGGDGLITDIWNIDGGRLQGKISLGKGSDGLTKYDIDCPPTQMTPCRDVAVSGNTLYMATSDHPGSAGAGDLTNEIAAFDLTTGTSKWLTKDGAQPMDLVGIEGDSLVVYQQTSYEDPGKILKVNESTGAMSVYKTFSSATQAQEHTAYGPGVNNLTEGWHNDSLAMSLTEITESGSYPDLLTVLH